MNNQNGIILAAIIALLTLTAYARRDLPTKVDPVTGDGIQYEAPNRLTRVVVVEAWDETSHKLLWEQTVYEMKIDPELEEDVQWDFIKTLQLDGNTLIIATESRRAFRLNVKTREIEKDK